MSTYTPTTATIRAEYAGRVEAWEMTHAEQEAARAEEVVEFDRWLAAHDAQVAAKAVRDAADDIAARANGSALIANADRWGGYYHGMRSGMQNEEQALRIRADRIEGR